MAAELNHKDEIENLDENVTYVRSPVVLAELLLSLNTVFIVGEGVWSTSKRNNGIDEGNRIKEPHTVKMSMLNGAKYGIPDSSDGL